MAQPTAENKYRPPIKTKIGFRPYLSINLPPNKDPSTVPHSAIDIMNVPWNHDEVFQRLRIGSLAPDITTVSKPNKNPAIATAHDHFCTFFINIFICEYGKLQILPEQIDYFHSQIIETDE